MIYINYTKCARATVKTLSVANIGRATVPQIIMNDEVRRSYQRWANATNNSGTLIGGIAFSFYGRPRTTMDVDLIYIQEQDIPETVKGFKRVRPHTFRDNLSHVEIEVLVPHVINVDPVLVRKVVETANVDAQGNRVASVAGIIALKLGRCSRQDITDIAALMALSVTDGHVVNPRLIDISEFDLSPDKIEKYNALLTEVLNER